MRRLTLLAFALATAAALAADAGAQHPAWDHPAGGPERLILLGTAGGPQLRGDRSQPANLVVVGGKPYLVDCGEGCVTQLIKAGFRPQQVEQAFLTHMHLDHTAGIGSLAAFRWMAGATAPLTVYGPPGTARLMDTARGYLGMPGSVHAREVPGIRDLAQLVAAEDLLRSDGRSFEVFRDRNIGVSAVENSHFDHLRGADIGFGALRSFSYRIDTPTRSVVFTGDTGPSAVLEDFARGADVLVAEVMDVEGVMAAFAARTDVTADQLPGIAAQMRAKHLTPEAVGRLARAAGVKTVVLTHFAGAGGAEDLGGMIAAVQTRFEGRVLVGEDMMEL